MSLARRSPVRPLLLAVPVALGLLLGTAATAHATEAEDPRATVHEGNAKTCAQAGLDGSLLGPADLTFTGGAPNADQYLSITAAEDVTVTGIVIKGGPRYNLYRPGANGLPETPPWEDLRAPLNNGGNIPQISHWYACGTGTTDTSSSTPSTSETAETTETTGSTGPSVPGSSTTSDTSGTPSTSDRPTTSATSAAAVPAGEDGDLASTGFGGSGLIWLGALLVLGGTVLLVLFRARRGAA
ncbi:hypothetical protein [Amycolatopsis aidingensis]|uniref:hypothetical protein n=1 Tax=Amycolatopsis aidingensis TaxID=2842453 RepID=UPI001C0B24FE|nr:hypothetical protein [Amycolatopsis aidingensis]